MASLTPQTAATPEKPKVEEDEKPVSEQLEGG